MKIKPTTFLDIIGISSATICLAHCLIFPILTIFPITFINNNYVDTAFACIGMFVVSKIILSNSPQKIKIISGCSIILVVFGVILESVFNKDSWLILIGGIVMIVGHILNYKSHYQ